MQVELPKEKVITNQDGKETVFMVYEEDSKTAFRCECGSNCFHKYHRFPKRYYCNACGAAYIGE